MSRETLRVTFDEDGAATYLAHPSLEGLREDALTAESRRASHVEPEGLVLRWLFRLLRRRCGGHGRVAAFTRRWPCGWRVDMGPSGGPLLRQVYMDRKLALRAERGWLRRERGL